jgi:STE24 endopeptidase
MTAQVFTTIFVSLFILKIVVKLGMDIINLRHLKKNSGKVPPSLKGLVDSDLLLKTDSYHTAKMSFSIISFLFNSLLVAIFLFTPAYGYYTDWVKHWPVSYFLQGIGFFGVLILIGWLIELPFDYYYHFHIEAAYGFNKYRIKGWIIDSFKSLLVNTVITILILVPAFGIWGNHSSFNWRNVFIGWSLASIIIITLVYFVPVLIIPFFYKLQPLSEAELRSRIMSLVEKAGFKARRIFIADESQRSTHADASFSGFGKTKTIILFDTLLKNYEETEILGILAHEIGHGKMRHILKLLVITILQAFIYIWFASYLLGANLPYDFANIPNIFYSGIFITYYFFFELLGYFIRPMLSLISRRFEYQADAFSKRLIGSGAPLIKTFEKFVTRELDNINPHPLYESFYYSHPSLLKRIEALKD